MYLAFSLLSPMVLLAAAPFGWPLAIALGSITLLSVLVLASVLSPLIAVSDNRLLAGKMAIPLNVIASAEVIPKEDLRSELGPKLDARAQLMIRGDLKTAVKIQISDPMDPTPYLVVSTRRPEELVGALRANRT